MTMLRVKLDINTPVNNMLDSMPIDLIKYGKFFDPSMGGGQFMREVENRKRRAGVSEDEIKNTCFGYTDGPLSLNYAKAKYGLVGTYKVANFLETYQPMPFDVYVGNPPYQASTITEKDNRQGDFWYKFLLEQMDKNPVIIAMVTPKSIFSAGRFGSDKNKVVSILNNGYGFTHIWTDVSKHFNVGIEIVSFIIQKNYVGKTLLVDKNEYIQISKNMPLPFILNGTNCSIMKKCFNKDNRWSFKEKIHAEDNDYVVALNAGRYKQWKKLYIGLASNNPNSAAQGMFISKNKVEIFRSIFTSKLFTYMFRIMGGESAQSSTGILQSLPYVDTSRKWTDAELYNHFKLTANEIKTIEESFN